MNLKKVKLIHNPRSGLIRSPLLIRKLIESALIDAPFEYEFTETRYQGHARLLAEQAAAEGCDAVVAVGGDGTANEVATALLHSDVALGIIPVGSGNGLVRGLGIPMAVRKAAHLLIDGETRLIDAGRVHDRYFFGVAGFGFDALIGKIFNDQNFRGPLPYFTIGFREFFFYRPEVFILRFENRQIAVPALLVTVANTKTWGAGAIFAPDAQPDDGLLDICIIHRVKFFYALFHLPKLFTGKIDKLRKVDQYRTAHLQIVREKPGPYHYDGEPRDGDLELDIRVEPRALKIIVPAANSK